MSKWVDLPLKICAHTSSFVTIIEKMDMKCKIPCIFGNEELNHSYFNMKDSLISYDFIFVQCEGFISKHDTMRDMVHA